MVVVGVGGSTRPANNAGAHPHFLLTTRHQQTQTHTNKQIFHPEDRDFQLGDTLKNEVWVNPLAIYMSADFEEEGEEDGEEDEGAEEQEG